MIPVFNDKIEYINDNELNGILIDWNFIYKEYLRIIKQVCNSEEIFQSIYLPKPPMNSATWFVDMSERSVGKTTNYIIIGLLLYKYYGIKTEYIRLKKDGIMPKNASQLFKTIRMFNYIEVIFREFGFNDVKMGARCWYLVHKDMNGKILEEDTEEFMHMHSLENAEVDNEKSVYNSPKGDWILLDEFIPVDGITTEQQFINLCQLHSTIRRQRLSTKTVLLANTINKYTHFFKELCISKDVQTLHMGEQTIATTNRGVRVWVHLIKFSEKISERRILNNLQFYGFDNPKLNSIIGGEEWETHNYPHLPIKKREEVRKCNLKKGVYFKVYDDYLAVEFWKSDVIGKYMFIRQQTNTPDPEKSIIYTLETPTLKNEIYGLGIGRPIEKKIVSYYNQHRCYYNHNECGSQFEYYLNEIEKRKL